MATQPAAITVESVTLAFDHDVVQHDVSFDVQHGEIFVIMGASGSGKSTLLRSMIGLLRPSAGQISFDGKPLWTATNDQRSEVRRRCGILFQSGALWSSLTLAENVGLPLSQFTTLRPSEIAEVVSLKLALVGLAGFERYYPSEISGGMKKRAGLARAIALDPDILFFDEPSAGLDPFTATARHRNCEQCRVNLALARASASLSGICICGISIFADQRGAACQRRESKSISKRLIFEAKPCDLHSAGTVLARC